MRGDDVEVPLDDDCGASSGDRGTREVDPEDRRRLVVRGGIRAVQVLRHRLPEGAGAEAEHLTSVVTDREDEAVSETIPWAAAARRVGKPGVDQLLHLGSGLAGQVASQRILAGATGRREADPKAPGKRLGDPACGEELAARLPCRRGPEHVLVIRLRLGVELDRAAALPPHAACGGRAALELHARPVGEELEGLPEIDPLDLLDELEEVTALRGSRGSTRPAAPG